MKHLRKYNESNSKDVIDCIQEAFADFIDEGSEIEFNSDSLSFSECAVLIKLPTLHIVKRKLTGYSVDQVEGDIKIFKENAEKALRVFDDIETALNRIKDEYPDISHKIIKDVDRVYEGELLSYVAVILEWKFKKTKDVHGIDDEGNFY